MKALIVLENFNADFGMSESDQYTNNSDCPLARALKK